MESEKKFQEAIRRAPAATIFDEKNNVVQRLTGKKVEQEGLAGQIPATGPKPIYPKEGGGWTMHAGNASQTSSVSLDKVSGKITVKAPEMALKNESFKSSLTDTLKRLSSAYKANPDTKYSIVNSVGENEEKSIDDIIAELNAPSKNEDGTTNQDSLTTMATAAVAIETEKEAHKKATKLDLTDDQIMRMQPVNGKEATDQSLQLIPNLKEAKFLRDLETYDPETGYAQYADIMANAWNKEVTTSEDMIALIAALENYFAKGKYDDAEEYIRNVSMMRFIMANQPDEAWLRDAAENVRGFVEGVLSYPVEFGSVLGVAGADLMQNLGANVGQDVDYSNRYIVAGGTFNQWDRSLPKELVDAKIGRVYFDENGVPSYKLEKIQGTFDEPQDLGEFTRNAWKEAKTAYDKYLAYLNESQGAASAIGYAIAEMAASISAGNLVGGAVAGVGGLAAKGVGKVAGKIAKATINAGKVVTPLATTASGVGGVMLSASNQLTTGMQVMVKVANAIGKGAAFVNRLTNWVAKAEPSNFIFGIIGESLAEAIVGSPDMLIEVLDNNEITAENKEYLIANYVSNAIGWGVGLTIGKGLMKAGETVKGRAISFNASKKLFAIQNTVGDLVDRTILKLRRVEGDTLAERVKNLYDRGTKFSQKQANSLAAGAMLREARESITELESVKILGRTGDEIKADLAKLELKTMKLRAMENALTSWQKQGIDLVQGWLKDPESPLNASTQNFFEKAAELGKLERSAGDAFSPVKGAVTDVLSGKVVRLFSQTTTNYIKATEELAYITRYIAKFENATDASQEVLKRVNDYKKQKEELQQMIDAFTEKASPQLKQAADQFIDADRKFWHDFEDLRARLGLANADELKGMRDSGLWGKNGAFYAKATRRSQLSEYVRVHRDGSTNIKTYNEYEKYSPGATGDFADPLGEMQIALMQAGQEQASRSFVLFSNALSGSLLTKVSGEETELYRALDKGLIRDYEAKAAHTINALVEDSTLPTDGRVSSIMDMALSKIRFQNRIVAKKQISKVTKERTEENLASGMFKVEDEKGAASAVRHLDSRNTDEVWDRFYPGTTPRNIIMRKLEELPTTTKRTLLNKARKMQITDAEVTAREQRLLRRRGYTFDDEGNVTGKISRSTSKTNAKASNLPEAGTEKNISEKTAKQLMKKSSVSFDGDTLYLDGDAAYMILPLRGKKLAEAKGETHVVSRLENSELEEALKDKNFEISKDDKTALRKFLSQFKEAEKGAKTAKIKAPDLRARARYELINERLNAGKTPDAKTPDPDFEMELKRSILSGDERVTKDKNIYGYLTEKREATYKLAQETYLKDISDEVTEMERKIGLADGSIKNASWVAIKGFEAVMLEDGKAPRAAIDQLCKFYGLEDSEEARRFFAFKAYMDNRDEYKKKFKDKIEEALKKDAGFETQTTAGRAADTIVDNIDAEMKEIYTDAYHMVKEMNPDATLDADKKIKQEISELREKIEGVKANQYAGEKNIIAVRRVDNGQLEYYETDPLLAQLTNFAQSPAKMNGLTQAIYNTNYLWAKLFRLGTTAINIKSIISQSFRDPINMIISGGAYRTTQQNIQYIRDVAGDSIVRWVEMYEPEAFARMQKKAQETGQDIKQLAAERELALGRAMSPAATESEMYSNLKTARAARTEGGVDFYDDNWMDKTTRGIDKVAEVLGGPNRKREEILRNLSYSNGLHTALKRGYSLAEAREYARFMMNEATTNFSRATHHLVSFRDTVPYFGAAINGTKSFWRLASLDPVGVFGRLVGGIIIPTIALTANSLGTEENREVYRNIKEYEKDDNLVFVVNGQVFSVPLPQELGAFIAPFRQMVEGMHGVNSNTFPQLFWNDILGFSPIDLSGFADLDFSKLESDSPGFMDRIGRGVSRMWSQLAPAPLKSAMMLVTGVDPYTGNHIDTSYLDYDSDGNPIVRDYTSGVLAKELNNMFQSWGWQTSAPVVQNTLSNIMGDASVDILDFLTSLAKAVPEGKLDWSMDTNALARGEAYNPFYTLNERMSAPVTVSAKDEAQTAWKTEVSKLYRMKEEILRSDAWKEYLAAKRTTTDPEKLKTINSSKKDLVENYFNTIKTVVLNLQQNYGAEFTAAKYATVLSLMTMDEQTLDGGSYGDYLNKESYKVARAQAIQTMIELGFPSSSSQDILGTYTTDSDGNIYVRTYSPLAILQLDDTSGASIYSQSGKQHEAVIRNLLNDAGAYGLREQYYEDVDAAYDAEDYKEVERIKNDYDEKIISVIAPYIRQYTPESVLTNEVITYLESYLFVPSSYMGKGKYYSSSTGLNKNEGYIKSFINKVFGKGENSLK